MDNKPKDLIEKEINFIEQSIISKEFADKFIFLINRLYNDFQRKFAQGRMTFETINYFDEFGYGEIPEYILPKLKIVQDLYIQYSNDSLKSDKIALLNDKCFLTLAPFFYDEKKLKSLILHELTLLEKDEIENYRKKSISIFKELIERISLPYTWNLIDKENNEKYYFEPNETKEGKELAESILSAAETFEVNIAEDLNIDLIELYNDYNEEFDDKEDNWSADVLDSPIRKTTNLSGLIYWLKKVPVTKTNKIEYIESNYKIFKMIVVFFEKNKVKLSGNRKEQIKVFINNVGETSPSKNLVCKKENTIDFFSAKTFKSFLALLVYLYGKGIIKFKDNSYLYNILINELKDKKIGISDRHRLLIGEFKNFSYADLEIETNFSI